MADLLVTSTNPYYDDYKEEKDFYRILFKPSVAVQARELTQMQTILQNQISKFGSHVFENGSRVLGGEINLDTEVTYLLVAGTYNETDINVANFMGQIIVGQQSGARARVVHYIEAEDTDENTLYVKLLNGIDFDLNEDIVAEDILYSATILNTESAIGLSSMVGINEGYYFYNGLFLRVGQQQIILDKYDNKPTYKIGITVYDKIVTYETDNSLLDPANGSPNYGAHGADRLQYNLYLEKKPIDELGSINFIELMEVQNGEITFENKYTQYSELEKNFARRTFDESGNFTVEPFDIKIENNSDNSDNFDVLLGAGKAYVRGYEFETISTSKLTLPKARNTEEVTNFDINAQYGNYCMVSTFTGVFDPTSLEKVKLKSSSSVIGSANIRFITQDSNKKFRFYLTNIVMTGSHSFNEVVTIKNQNESSSATVEAVSGEKLLGTSFNSMLFATPHTSVKTLKPGNITNTEYVSQKTFDASFASGIASINIGGNNSFYGASGSLSDTLKQRYVIILTNVVNPGSTGLSKGQVIDMTKSGRTITLSGGNQTATFDVKDGSFQATATVIASVNLNTKVERTKALNTTTVTGTLSDGKMSLKHSDIYRLISVKDSEGIDITNQFKLDNGQRDNLYDHGSITLIAGEANGSITAEFEYFTHSGSGYFSVDSYTSIIDYDQIPSYTTNNGVTYNLRDVIDFRPRRADNSDDISIPTGGIDIPRPDNNINANYEFYLSRIDKIILREDRKFDYIQGVSDLTPTTPNDRDDSMSLYILTIPAYTFSVDDITVKYIDNKRYTMRDIGKLDTRISNLEYFASLSILEESAKNEPVLDETGEDMYKSGILVDSFIGHNVGDLTNSSYKCSIDNMNRYLRAPFESKSFNFEVDSSSLNVTNHNGLVLPKSETVSYIKQNAITESYQINPFNLTNWIGNISITPNGTNFLNLNKNPDVVINENGVNNGWNTSASSPFNLHYGYWKNLWYGNEINKDKDSILNIESSTSIQKVINNRRINVDVIPYTDAISLTFNVKAVKPNTMFDVFIDDIKINQYVSGGRISDANGEISNVINLPAGLIRTGTHLLRFINQSENIIEKASTMAEINFYALGLLNNRTDNVVSTLPPLIQHQELVEDYTLSNQTMTRKMIAQTFTVSNKPNGIFIDSVDLFFKAKDNSLPVTIDIRPVQDGKPHKSKLVPFSQVTMKAASVIISNAGTLSTRFQFKRPLFLIEGEYAIVVHTNSSKYQIYRATVGQTISNSSANNKVSKQVGVGDIFVNNSKNEWLLEQNKVLKFNINKLSFNTGGSLVLKTKSNNVFGYDTFYAHIHNIIQGTNNIKFYYKKSLDGSTLDTNWNEFENDKDISIPTQAIINNNYLFMVRCEFLNDTDSACCIDLEKTNLLLIQNIINNDSLEETDPVGGRAAARYITKQVTLKEGFDADSIKVYFEAYRPMNTDIEVYYRVQNKDDESIFGLRPFVKMVPDNNEYSVNVNDIKEYSFNANNISYDGYDGFRTFAIKIVFKSANTYDIPFIQNLKILTLV